uniref:Centrosomin N-terminal motif 1 domain-containing protein n=1 Tax=Leptobrachium leishanense TaxID=445787 RepID=A0A8C5MU86_9ANUR
MPHEAPCRLRPPLHGAAHRVLKAGERIPPLHASRRHPLRPRRERPDAGGAAREQGLAGPPAAAAIQPYYPARFGKGGRLQASPNQEHTMKDFEMQITELKKENFNLKLRIYFLEEQIQKTCCAGRDEVHRLNVELKVEVESLKHELDEKQRLLYK